MREEIYKDSSKRFYGVYRGTCVDNNDPDGLGRITLQVTQILGSAITNWVPNMGGQIAQQRMPYGTFASTSTQLVSAANTATVITFNTTEDSNYIELTNSSRLTVRETGDYFFQFSAMFAKAGSSSAQADIWLRKNGVDIPRTNSRITLQGNPNEVLVTLNYILDLDANDYVQVVFSSADTAMSIKAYSGLTLPTRPDIPSIIATLNLIGKYKPQPGTPVWVSFIDGDPNFPVWIGAY